MMSMDYSNESLGGFGQTSRKSSIPDPGSRTAFLGLAP